MFRSLSNYSHRIYLWIFTLIAAAILIGPTSLAHAADITLAWAANTESDLAGYYIYYKTGTSGAPYNGTGINEGDSPIRISLGDLSDPANPAFTLHGLSDTQTTYTVLTAYNTEGNESAYSNEVAFQPSAAPVTPTLSSLSISGDSSVIENSNAGYTATATFSDGSTQIVSSSATWNDNSSYAAISNNGVLSASEVSADTSVTIQASYTIGGVTRTATKVITIVDEPPANVAPDTPVVVTPEMGQTEVEIPLDITTEPFSDPNNDGQTQSQWQISEQSDFATRVVDITSNNYLTTFPVPHMVLKSDHHYYVRVRFFDSYAVASNWSDAVEFTTAISAVDLNGNGILDVDEVDNSVDFNLDGIPDISQPQIIKCVRDYDGLAAIGIQTVSGSTAEIESLEIIDPDTISDNFNRPDDLIFGLFAYRLRVQNPGDTIKVRVYFSGEVFPSDVFYKYDTINGWQNYSEHTTFNDDGQSITLEVKDGGYGDSDGLANGIIVDPGGIASRESTFSTNEGSNVMGCFIATAAFGTKFEKHVQLFRRFRDLYLMPNSIGRAFVKTYYKYSPPMADFIAKHDVLRTIVRWGLAPIIAISWITLKTGLPSTVGLMLFLLSGFIGFCMVRRKHKS